MSQPVGPSFPPCHSFLFLQNLGLRRNVRVSYTFVFFFFSSSSESGCFCVLACLGFTTQQAEIIVSALVKITETNMNIVYSDTVTKVQQVMRAGWFGTLEIRKQDITSNKYSSSFLDDVLLKSVW